MKVFKKLVSLGCIASLILSITACGAKSQKVSIATGGTSGTYYGFMGIVANVLTEKTGITFTTESTGASKANVQLVDQGESQIAILQNDVMSYAYTGTDLFATDGKSYKTFSAIGSVYPENIQIVAKKGINSVNDLRGKKVSVGDAGSGVEFNARQILGIYGIDIDKDIVKNNQSFADSADSIKNGTIDAAFVVAGAPTVAITELASTHDFTLVSLDDAHIAQLIEKYPFYTKTPIPANTYAPVQNDVNGVAVMATLIASNQLSEDIVYQFTKGLFENKSSFQHAKAQNIDLNTAITGIGQVPFHPGAQKYYKEQGVLQ